MCRMAALHAECKDAAYCYRCSVVCICVSVENDSVLKIIINYTVNLCFLKCIQHLHFADFKP